MMLPLISFEKYIVTKFILLYSLNLFQVIPSELEEVLETHPGVLESCVTSILHEEDGERPVACVVRRPGCEVTAQEIKDLIAGNQAVTLFRYRLN